ARFAHWLYATTSESGSAYAADRAGVSAVKPRRHRCHHSPLAATAEPHRLSATVGTCPVRRLRAARPAGARAVIPTRSAGAGRAGAGGGCAGPDGAVPVDSATAG